MHELSIAQALLDQAIRIASENNALKISEIEVELGVMRLVVPEALEEGFKVLSHNTPAWNAKLILTEVPITAQCRQCKQPFTADMGNLLCPQCQTGDVAILSGNDIILKTVICETTDEKETL